jgi:hypothetical protein
LTFLTWWLCRPSTMQVTCHVLQTNWMQRQELISTEGQL